LSQRELCEKAKGMLILASESPTRKALLQNAGIAFEARAARVNERELEGASPVEQATPGSVALMLASAKALSVNGDVVIGADQILSLGDTILHKASDLREARARLDALRGRTHELHTAVALAKNGRVVWEHVVVARLTMRAFTDAERDAVLAEEGDAVLGSAGAYRLEGPSIRLFERIEGDYFAILGLPLLPLLAALRTYAPALLD
jgi:septum formation protein